MAQPSEVAVLELASGASVVPRLGPAIVTRYRLPTSFGLTSSRNVPSARGATPLRRRQAGLGHPAQSRKAKIR